MLAHNTRTAQGSYDTVSLLTGGTAGNVLGIDGRFAAHLAMCSIAAGDGGCRREGADSQGSLFFCGEREPHRGEGGHVEKKERRSIGYTTPGSPPSKIVQGHRWRRECGDSFFHNPKRNPYSVVFLTLPFAQIAELTGYSPAARTCDLQKSTNKLNCGPRHRFCGPTSETGGPAEARSW